VRKVRIARISGPVDVCQRAASIAQASPSNGKCNGGPGRYTSHPKEERR
jgi:hypothetical protein